MSLKCYCPNLSCAEPILYDLTKPNMCPFCGTNLNNNVSIPNKISQSKGISIKKPKKINNDIGDVEEYDEIPEINIDDVEIIAQKEQGIKFGELASQQKTGITRHKIKKINKKEEIMAFRKEAGFGGRTTIEIVDNGVE